ncbi:hypothetical protein [Lysinibacillus fusiformis]|uniref:hypothetical protein n=2 Tax=Lysinibacillus fusiformis TaxID=28031 RepID=UPI000881C26D|nr:hypothetical protein [Lysinibacillus fusiformis]SCX38447.1 hypothetical protein SAMN02787108_00294 [Lysinibacillus fusiformis]SDB05505.1 hypothetical protein SAMN02787070_00282 [Lysinibacillus fusiformis]SFH75360.1 hypothetical protein SAMN02787080_00281 [Lysinibacillus fusiformis]SFT29767.1 hypothetical protein SAMN02787099_04564 [Lysinibacillus fusiformis]
MTEKKMDHQTALGLRELFCLQSIEDVLYENGLTKSPKEIEERAKKKLAESKLTEEQKQYFKDKHIL